MRRILFLLVLIMVLSCGLGPRKLSGFISYKEPVITDNEGLLLKMNGVYVSLDKEHKIIDGIKGFYLYANGMYRYEYFENNFWRDPKKELKKRQLYYETSNDFGQYRIHNDTIIIQDFASNNNEFYSKWVIESKGIILNDSTIKLISSYSYLGKQELLKEPIVFMFYPTKIKPNSKKAWFLNKKWYKEGLHKSRR